MLNVGAYLMELREQRRPKLSRAKLAEQVGTTEMTISRIERGGQEPGGALLVRLVEALGASWELITKLTKAEDSPDVVQQLLADVAAQPVGTDEEEAVLSRLLDLLEQGVPPAEAARRARHGQ